MGRHRLRGVLHAGPCGQHALECERMPVAAMRTREAADRAIVVRDDLVEQDHRAALRQQVGDEGGCSVQWTTLRARAPPSRPGSRGELIRR